MHVCICIYLILEVIQLVMHIPAFMEHRVHQHVHKSLLLDHILSQLNPDPAFAPSFFKNNFTINCILSSVHSLRRKLHEGDILD